MHPWPADSSSNLGQTGGADTHTLTVAELPVHTPKMGINYLAVYGSTDAGQSKVTGTRIDIGGTGTKVVTGSTIGSGAAFSLMPPYIKVFAHIRAD